MCLLIKIKISNPSRTLLLNPNYCSIHSKNYDPKPNLNGTSQPSLLQNSRQIPKRNSKMLSNSVDDQGVTVNKKIFFKE